MHALVALDFQLGLRPAEIRALIWEHVDFKAGFPSMMWRTFASLMDEAGMDHQKIADTRCHRDKTTFERVYRHRLKPEIRQAASVMNRAPASMAGP